MLEIITETTYGKWRLSLDAAAPHQMKNRTNCEATIMFSMPNVNTISSRP